MLSLLINGTWPLGAFPFLGQIGFKLINYLFIRLFPYSSLMQLLFFASSSLSRWLFCCRLPWLLVNSLATTVASVSGHWLQTLISPVPQPARSVVHLISAVQQLCATRARTEVLVITISVDVPPLLLRLEGVHGPSHHGSLPLDSRSRSRVVSYP